MEILLEGLEELAAAHLTLPSKIRGVGALAIELATAQERLRRAGGVWDGRGRGLGGSERRGGVRGARQVAKQIYLYNSAQKFLREA